MDYRHIDLGNADHFQDLKDSFDTVICVNVLEHVPDEGQALRNIRESLEPGGRAIILVPQNPAIYGTLDDVLGHVKRYTRASLREALEREGFGIERMYDFNRITTPAWWFNGKILKRRYFSRIQLKGVNLMTWLFRLLDPILPWQGASLVAVARWPADAASDAG